MKASGRTRPSGLPRFKAPTLTELLANNPAIGQLANPNLRPEVSRGYDFGFEQPFLNDRVRIGSTAYRNSISDLIVNVFTGFTATYMNVSKAETRGVESFASVAVTERFKLRGDYTRTATKNENTDLGLLRRPGNKESVSAIWQPINPLTLSATVVRISSFVDVNRDTLTFIPRLNAPAYSTVNIAANYAVNKNVTAFARADNLTNHYYENPTGFARPGLGVFGGVRVTN